MKSRLCHSVRDSTHGKSYAVDTEAICEAVTRPTMRIVAFKSALTGTYRQVSSKHVAHYLAEFQYRFNRRYDLTGMLPHLSYVGLPETPTTVNTVSTQARATTQKTPLATPRSNRKPNMGGAMMPPRLKPVETKPNTVPA